MPSDLLEPTPARVDRLAAAFGDDGVSRVIGAARKATAAGRHGRMAEWQAVLDGLPAADPGWRIDDGVLVAGGAIDDRDALVDRLRGLIPWRKGPLRLGGVPIDTEWRSDWKWDRVAPHVDLDGKRVLDIGAGNGYFAWRMLDGDSASVIACDPTLVFWYQHRAIEHFAGPAPLDLLPVAFEALPATGAFDVAFSMGVLYHRRDPLEHLAGIRRHLAAGATALIETLVLPGDDIAEFDPPDRYANMRNVHRLPTVPRLLDWLEETGFEDATCVDLTATSTDEQRPTEWMPFHSLTHALAPDRTRTIEGYPPPLRASVVAKRR
ncbi:tRNA 5-methoxyuridine(34)/uridine 5-oxyacetic acid(34) synthase CmoB [Halomonas denitrificans]|nr:tRNA 5-methoxyuridine(34)/uridine 5-oxyacetic acid(34) synthase CmoB [Halomonas denitrificans]